MDTNARCYYYLFIHNHMIDTFSAQGRNDDTFMPISCPQPFRDVNVELTYGRRLLPHWPPRTRKCSNTDLRI